jgi:hypothetical protein
MKDKAAATAVIRILPADINDLPNAARVHLHKAAKALGNGDLKEADRAITLALVYAPQHPEIKRLLGILLHRLGRYTEAVASLREALKARSGDANILIALSQAQADANDISGAIETLRLLVVQNPDASALYQLGRMLEQHAELDEAMQIMRQVLALEPQHAQARLQYARNLFYTGHPEDAIAQFRKLLHAEQETASAWYGLAEMKTVKFDADDLVALKTQRAKPRLAGMEKATLLHAIGKAYEDNNDYRAAYEAYCEAAQLERAEFPCDNAAFAVYIDSIRNAFPKPLALSGAQGSEVIFIVGMPRSGSTLIEQILAAHPQVEGASELPDLILTLDRESRQRKSRFPEWVTAATAQDWQRIGADYLAHTARWRLQRPRFTDKSPGNWMQAEAALAMLPGARIINCRRDPVETAWSCFKQFFAPGRMVWGSSFGDIAYFWRRCTDHCDYLAARFPNNVRIQSYEKLVDDPEGQTRELLAFCGLEFDSGCLRFHESSRTIRTASAAQVREPIRRATTNSDRYGALLDPLREAIAREQRELGTINLTTKI